MKKTLLITRRLLSDSRTSLLWAFIALFLLATMLVFAFPSIKTVDFSGYLESFPPALMEAFNINSTDFSDFTVFISTEYLGFTWVFVLLPFVISWGTDLAGRAEKGITALDLSYPVKRVELVSAQFLNLIIKSLLATVFVVVGILIPAQFIETTIDYESWLRFSLFLWLFITSLAFVAGLFSSVLLIRSKATWFTAGFLIGSYFLNILAKLVESINDLKYLSIFNYYGDPVRMLKEGVYDETAVAVFFIIIIVTSSLGIFIFRRKDLPAG
ncbi:MAG: ABC transporter permease subunit [Candidatus Dojkabacteria bacterium]